MKKKLFFAGMAALLLSFGLVLVGCPNNDGGGDDGGGSSFDGSTLTKTKWVATQANEPVLGGLSVDIKATLEFTSDTAGTAKFEVTKWTGTWDDEMKGKIQQGMTEDSGDFTSTYAADAKTGTYTLKSGTEGTFTVDVGKKELTTTEVDEDETKTMIYKLQ